MLVTVHLVAFSPDMPGGSREISIPKHITDEYDVIQYVLKNTEGDSKFRHTTNGDVIELPRQRLFLVIPMGVRPLSQAEYDDYLKRSALQKMEVYLD